MTLDSAASTVSPAWEAFQAGFHRRRLPPGRDEGEEDEDGVDDRRTPILRDARRELSMSYQVRTNSHNVKVLSSLSELKRDLGYMLKRRAISSAIISSHSGTAYWEKR